MTTALEGVEGSASRPGRSLPSWKTRYLLYRRLGGPQGRSGQVRKISPPTGFDPRTVQPIASRYTDWATRPTFLWYFNEIRIFSTDFFEKYWNSKYHENPFSGSRVLTWGRTDRRTDMPKLIVALHIFFCDRAWNASTFSKINNSVVGLTSCS